jgi:glyoxylase-like metal-dependent hydrolase (beta-lactamase superfamily II)
MKVEILDTHYLRDRFAAVFLLENNGRYGIIEANTGKAIPGILEILKHRKVPLEKIEFIGITHVHLDHAAGTAALLAETPNAKVYCHPKRRDT